MKMGKRTHLKIWQLFGTFWHCSKTTIWLNDCLMFITDENKFNNIKSIQYAWKHGSNVATTFDLRQIGGFLRVLRFPLPIKPTATI
jgi:hypothetical protein